MKKVERHVKVKRSKVDKSPQRTSRARSFFIKPDPSMPHRVQVFISPTAAHMHRTAALKGFTFNSDFEGMVKSYHSKTTGISCVRPRQIIAHMFLNNRGIRSRGAEILCHECAHAGMAWARLRKADLSKMPGEEIMCYATGRMHEQLVHIVHMLKIW